MFWGWIRMRLIDADKLKAHYAWWGDYPEEAPELAEEKKTFDVIVDLQPTVDAAPITRAKWIPDHASKMDKKQAQGLCLIQVRRGKWIGKPIAGYATVKCSECGNVFLNNNGRWNFCPDCGARMEE